MQIVRSTVRAFLLSTEWEVSSAGGFFPFACHSDIFSNFFSSHALSRTQTTLSMRTQSIEKCRFRRCERERIGEIVLVSPSAIQVGSHEKTHSVPVCGDAFHLDSVQFFFIVRLDSVVASLSCSRRFFLQQNENT